MKYDESFRLRAEEEFSRKEKSVRDKREFQEEIQRERIELVPNFLVLVRDTIIEPEESPRVMRA